MKRNLHLFLILLISLPAFSQNGAPINTAEKFCYSSDDDLEIINNVLWVDSTVQMGDHEIYYFNKIVAPCDTCADTLNMLMNQPQFLLDFAKVYNNGDWIFHGENQQFVLKTNFTQDEWIFDEENNITAQITGASQIMVFEELDDVIEISLSNGEFIILSQNHGILNWMDEYHLVGIEGRDLGVIVPTFRNMYQNWSTGDVICYYQKHSWFDGLINVDVNKYKYTILDILAHNDSIVLETLLLRKHELTIDDGFGGTQYEETFLQEQQTLVFYPDILTESYPNEIITDPSVFPEYYYGGEDTLIMKLEHHEWGGFKKTALLKNNPSTGEDYTIYSCFDIENILIPTDWQNTITSNYLNLPQYSTDYTFYETYLLGFEWEYDYKLVGLIDDGDTLGIIYEDDVLLGTNQLSPNTNWLIYPNPANDFITIQTPDNQSNIEYKIFSLNGILLKEGVFNNKESNIRIKELPKGMYFIELNINGEKSTKKWIKN